MRLEHTLEGNIASAMRRPRERTIFFLNVTSSACHGTIYPMRNFLADDFTPQTVFTLTNNPCRFCRRALLSAAITILGCCCRFFMSVVFSNPNPRLVIFVDRLADTGLQLHSRPRQSETALDRQGGRGNRQRRLGHSGPAADSGNLPPFHRGILVHVALLSFSNWNLA